MLQLFKSADIWVTADACFISAVSAVFTMLVATQIVTLEAALAVSFTVHPVIMALIYFKTNIFEITR